MKEVLIIPQRDQIEESLKIAKEYNAFFEYNDFFLPAVLDDKEEKNERIRFYKNLDRDRSRDTMHGAFLDIILHSADPKIREASQLRVRQSMEIAKELEIRGVVFHTNMIANFKEPAYMKNWVSTNAAFYKKMLEEYPDIYILVENIFDLDPDMLLELAEEMAGYPFFGVCLDYAHASVSAVAAPEWFRVLKPYIKHMHINDNDLKNDLHLALGSGRIDYRQFADLLWESKITPSVLVEVNKPEDQRTSLSFMKKEGIYPFSSPVKNGGLL